jgi:tetratricopeptide (TPR) repeat protein
MRGDDMTKYFNLLVALLLITSLAACSGPEERKAKYRLRAQEYIQQGNFPKARVALRNVLKIDPKDPEAYFLFAQVEEKEHNWRNAFANYQRTVELAPDHKRAQMRLAKFYLEARMIEKVSEITEKVLTQDPGYVPAETLRIAVTAINGRLPEAVKQGEALLLSHPTDPDAALILATLYLAQNRGAEAEVVLTKAREANPENMEVLDGLGTVYSKTGAVQKTEAIFRRMIELEPHIFDHRIKLVQFYDQHQEYAKAEATLREALELDRDSEMRHLMLAEYLNRRGTAEQAIAALKEAQRQLPHATKIRFALGKFYEDRQQLPQARMIYEALRDEFKKEPAALEAQVRLAALDWSLGQEEKAERQLREVLRENPRSMEGLLLQGKIALKRGDGKDAILAFRSVLKDQPELVEGHLLLGQAHLLSGEATLARESFDRAASLNPELSEPQILLAEMDIVAGQKTEAKRRIDAVLAREPKNFQALSALYRLQFAEQDWTHTEQTLGRLRGAGAGQAATDMAEGALYQAQQQWEKATAAYEKAFAAAPEAPEPLLALVQLDRAQGNDARARARLEKVLANDRHPYAHGLLGELLLAKGDKAGAADHLLSATRENPQWSMPWFHLATIRITEKRGADAQALLREGLRANPQSGELRLLLATSLTETGSVDEAISEYETILKKNPHAILAANNLASLLIDRKGDPQSLERALALSRDFEREAPNPVFLDTLGWVHLKLGHQDEALRVMRLAVAKAPGHPVLNYHLGAAYAESGRKDEAKTYLQKALSTGQTFAGIDDARSLLTGLNG